MKIKIIASIFFTVMLINLIFQLKIKSPAENNEVDEVITEKVPEKKTSRKIASTSTTKKPTAPAKSITEEKTELAKPEVKRAELEKSNFARTPQIQNPVYSGGRFSPPPARPSLNKVNAPVINYDMPKSNQASTEKKLKAEEDKYTLNSPLLPTKPQTVAQKSNVSSVQDNRTNTASKTTSTSLVNSCSASSMGGSFNNPIGITLNCTSDSEIHYCIGLDTGSGCCDPHTAGSIYNSQIIVGPANGTYCLSYFGVSSAAGTTTDYTHSYTINSTLPNLQVGHPQIFYQTTQLAGKTFVTSSDFGKSGYKIGQINMMTHDPGPAALDLKCDEIVSNYTTYTTPNALEVLTALDVSGDNSNVQIEIPLRVDQMNYGENFITSYIVNQNFVVPLYSCSTSKITLNDFEYFQDDVAFGDTGTNSVREFTGGLSPYGFFEEETAVYRGPAGASVENNAGQKLEYGLFGIFF